MLQEDDKQSPKPASVAKPLTNTTTERFSLAGSWGSIEVSPSQYTNFLIDETRLMTTVPLNAKLQGMSGENTQHWRMVPGRSIKVNGSWVQQYKDHLTIWTRTIESTVQDLVEKRLMSFINGCRGEISSQRLGRVNSNGMSGQTILIECRVKGHSENKRSLFRFVKLGKVVAYMDYSWTSNDYLAKEKIRSISSRWQQSILCDLSDRYPSYACPAFMKPDGKRQQAFCPYYSGFIVVSDKAAKTLTSDSSIRGHEMFFDRGNGGQIIRENFIKYAVKRVLKHQDNEPDAAYVYYITFNQNPDSRHWAWDGGLSYALEKLAQNIQPRGIKIQRVLTGKNPTCHGKLLQ